MSLADCNSGTHFLTPSAYNRFRRLISRRSDSSISDAESIQSSLAKEQGHGHLTLSAYNRFRSLVSRRSDSSFSDAESMQSSQAEEQVFSTHDPRERGFSKLLGFFVLKPNAKGKQTLHGLHNGDSGRFSRDRELSEIAEQAKRRAEIARLTELHTLKGHIESVMERKGLDMENIQLYYTV